MAVRINYERGACGRCGGSGEYSYCAMYGTRCFGCGGSGTKLTRNGKRAANAVTKFIHERYAKPIEEIRVGAQVRFPGDERWRRVMLAAHARDEVWALETRRTTYNAQIGTLVDVRPSLEQFAAELVPYARRFKGATIEMEAA